jgi:hypothetical protein
MSSSGDTNATGRTSLHCRPGLLGHAGANRACGRGNQDDPGRQRRSHVAQPCSQPSFILLLHVAVFWSCLAMNLGPPPAHADKQETPVMKKLRLFALKGVADELERPSHKKKPERIKPQPVNEDACEEQGERNQNCRYPQRMAYAVYRMLMAAGILRDPLLISASAQHSGLMIHG